MAAIDQSTLPKLVPADAPLAAQRLAQQQSDRTALTGIGGSIASGAQSALAAAKDIVMLPSELGGSIRNQLIRPINAFGGNIPYADTNLGNGPFPRYNALNPTPETAAPATALPTTASAPALPATTEPQPRLFLPQPTGAVAPADGPEFIKYTPQAAPAPKPLTPIEQGIQQQQSYQDRTQDRLNALVAGIVKNNPTTGGTILHAMGLGNAFANAYGGTNNFATLQEQQAATAGTNRTALATNAATNASQQAIEQMRAEQSQRQAELSAETQRDQLIPTVSGQTPNTDPNTKITAPYIYEHSLVSKSGSGAIRIIPLSGQGMAQAANAPSANHVAYLKAHPENAASFDTTYGVGAATKILGK